jgi:hypothetical protein
MGEWLRLPMTWPSYAMPSVKVVAARPEGTSSAVEAARVQAAMSPVGVQVVPDNLAQVLCFRVLTRKTVQQYRQ